MLESWKLAPALATGMHGRAQARRVHPALGVAVGGHLRGGRAADGVFNLVNGIGEEAGDALVKHPDVPLISFTGESRTGQLIFAQRARRTSRAMSMELGGKSPAVVFADADLDAAIDSTMFGVFSLNGERCTAGSRILVERAGLRRVRASATPRRRRRIVVGDPHDREDRGRGARAPRALREGDVATSRSARREGRLRRRRRPARRACRGQLRGADGLRRRPAGRPDLPGGDLRPGRRDHPVRHRRGGAAAGQRRALRPRRLHLDQRPAAARTRSRSRSRPGMVWLNCHNVRDLRTPVRRRQGLRARPRGRLPLASTSTPTSRPCTSRSATVHTPALRQGPDVSRP